jgi:RNA polymerase sigma factor (sigma-70 family)
MVKKKKGGMFSPSPYTTGASRRLTTGEEIQSIAIYQETRDSSVAEEVLKSRALWAQSIIANMPMPGYADLDTVFSDVMLAIYESLSNYNPDKASLSTYLWRVIYNSALTSVKEQDPQADQFLPDMIADELPDYSDAIANARRIILNIPHDTMNERARKVAHMMLKGYMTPEIASTLHVTRSVADEIIKSIRRYIAWCMVNQGLSAEPIISDKEIMELASEYASTSLSVWK